MTNLINISNYRMVDMDVLRCTNCQKKDLDSFPKKKRDKLPGPELISCRALGTLLNATFIIRKKYIIQQKIFPYVLKT